MNEAVSGLYAPVALWFISDNPDPARKCTVRLRCNLRSHLRPRQVHTPFRCISRCNCILGNNCFLRICLRTIPCTLSSCILRIIFEIFRVTIYRVTPRHPQGNAPRVQGHIMPRSETGKAKCIYDAPGLEWTKCVETHQVSRH